MTNDEWSFPSVLPVCNRQVRRAPFEKFQNWWERSVVIKPCRLQTGRTFPAVAARFLLS